MGSADLERSEAETLRQQILDLVARYAELAHAPKSFVPGSSPVPVSGKVYGAHEMQLLVDSSLDFWLTTGRFNDQFEERLSRFLGVRHALTCNSGSSANLLAVTALTSPLLRDRALKPGDEVITCATGFPTTVNPLIQNGLVPVFLDVDIPTYNIRADQIEAALSERTRAIVVAHTLGNPFDLGTIMDVARRHNLLVVEDCCDALGARYDGKLVGTFGDVGTLSFYPAHHITMGEGGAVFTQGSSIKRALESFRDWGRDCWCPPGKDNTCGKRFDRQLGTLPCGYDHKYTYSHLGYNLKITDMQAAVGLAQMDRLEDFIAARRRNFALLKEGLAPLADRLILPEATPNSDPSWFGFPITVAEGASFTRDELVRHLESNRIATRLLFGGNLLCQPYMKGRNYRVFGSTENSDRVMNGTFWIGLFPGLGEAHIAYMLDVITAFVSR
ncbi:lipopolysaccharide biosynthesis protein RfbH [Azospirillum sp. BE72]|uniref:lipopolysaccharide biosynthesis protein RfbH n=1 Tax=Azospirillum sp. BE72 TaxID=2817776 RepID=UPI00285D0042|nr:lipopolysaccharide biosynthesis protein RfbH [Azospirillum sp. BE72]MDR6775096.1 CDP-6-deoxy-D-xylo-4-hexulose-3-dehydrase [Azospirillum sp. BE72]